MPISEYSIETYENWSDKVVTLLSRFAHVRIERRNVKRLKVLIATESRYADEAWKSLFTDLRGVTNCSLVRQDTELCSFEHVLEPTGTRSKGEPVESELVF